MLGVFGELDAWNTLLQPRDTRRNIPGHRSRRTMRLRANYPPASPVADSRDSSMIDFEHRARAAAAVMIVSA